MTMTKWLDPRRKLSHEDKTISEHISETLFLINDYLNFYSLNEYREVAEFLVKYHDIGKSHVSWNFYSKEGHSHHSFEYLLENNIKFREKNLDPILKFLILKHHSSLSSLIDDKPIEFHGRRRSLKNVFEVLYKEDMNKTLDAAISGACFEQIVSLVDVFGLFKIADVCSAKNKRLRFKKPTITDDVIKRIVGKSLDENRWSEQKELTKLSDIALLRAYTGWGKTDASLLFLKNKNILKIFYLFPTITAINTFYEKIKKAVNNEVSKYFYFLDTEIKEDMEKLSNIWFIENFTSPINITTVDQILLSFLQVGRYFSKRVMFRGSGLIIDEVHLLNPLMLDLLTFFLKKYAKIYGFKIIMMSATLPNALIKFLSDNLQLSGNYLLDCSEGYKRKRRVRWIYEDEDIASEKVLEKIVNKKDFEKVLVVVNTVEQANTIGERLENYFKLIYGEDFIVFHARSMYKDRKNKERWLMNNREKPHILVATQVCEVSLDLSYDYLFTELAPIPSLIQRFGRVNRYKDNTENINVQIFRPHIGNQRRYPYAENDLTMAEEIVKELSGEKLVNEKQLIDKLDSIFDYERLLAEIRETRKEINVQYWEELLKYFYSFEVTDERLSRLLNYRDGFTTLVIPHPSCIESPTNDEVAAILSKSLFDLPFEEMIKLIAKIKELAVPVPFWWLKKAEREENIFPIIKFKDKTYNYKYGLRENKV